MPKKVAATSPPAATHEQHGMGADMPGRAEMAKQQVAPASMQKMHGEMKKMGHK